MIDYKRLLFMVIYFGLSRCVSATEVQWEGNNICYILEKQKQCFLKEDDTLITHGEYYIQNKKGIKVIEGKSDRGALIGFHITRDDVSGVLKELCYYTERNKEPDCIRVLENGEIEPFKLEDPNFGKSIAPEG